jgi:hypothetical protein
VRRDEARWGRKAAFFWFHVSSRNLTVEPTIQGVKVEKTTNFEAMSNEQRRKEAPTARKPRSFEGTAVELCLRRVLLLAF